MERNIVYNQRTSTGGNEFRATNLIEIKLKFNHQLNANCIIIKIQKLACTCMVSVAVYNCIVELILCSNHFNINLLCLHTRSKS